jgi:hypothetical protein
MALQASISLSLPTPSTKRERRPIRVPQSEQLRIAAVLGRYAKGGAGGMPSQCSEDRSKLLIATTENAGPRGRRSLRRASHTFLATLSPTAG